LAHTDPHTWFLPEGEIARSPAFTSGNEVTALVDGEAYFAHLAARLAAQRSGDYLHLTAWRATGNLQLEPTVPGAPTLLELVRDLTARGVTVRSLTWLAGMGGGSGGGGVLGSSQIADNISFVEEANAAGATAVLDKRNVFASSHHQKSAALSSDGDDWAYVGGIDIAPDRWDTPDHDQAPGRTRDVFDGWHDVHSAIRGPAVAQVWQNFTERWNDPTPAHGVPTLPGPTVPEPITARAPEPPAVSTQHVQLLRTLACGPSSFLPDGEQSVRLGYERAIERAEHYVYLEDQYLWPCTGDFTRGPGGLVTKLHEATLRGVKVILVLAHRNDLALTGPYHNQMQQDVLDLLRKDRPENVFVFDLRNEAGTDIYVHAKVMIVDDCLAVIGSSNISRRSQTSDSELSIAVVDDDVVPSAMDGVPVSVCRFAKDLRVALWSEHLGLGGSGLLEDPIEALARWPDEAASTPQAPKQVHHAVVHYVDSERPLPLAPDISGIMNLETTCS
jgi:phosphatidylserine/phosphatidylglycerophosphate/cardiolipin synthase-like enzyme